MFNSSDKFKLKSSSIVEIMKITDHFYISTTGWRFYIKDQDEYELVPDKFDISTLVPFESKVLVRDHKNLIWKPAIFGDYINNPDESYPYIVLGGSFYKYLIPYEGNEHLRGKTDDRRRSRSSSE